MDFHRPHITDEDRQGFRLFYEALEANRKAIDDAVRRDAERIPAFADMLRAQTPAQMEEQQKRSRAQQKAVLLDDKWEEYLTQTHAQGAQYAKLGIELSAWFDIVRSFRVALVPHIVKHYTADPQKVALAIEGASRYVDIAMVTIGEAYLDAKQDIIRQQSHAIRELSTPVLQVRARLLIVPLVGVMDTHRARQFTEQLLNAIRSRRARAVVIDITGVPVVDSKVANHLMQTVEAAALMGAVAFVSGMSPEIAQTLVTIGADLRGIRTAGDLQEAIEDAEALIRERAALDAQGASNGANGVDAAEA